MTHVMLDLETFGTRPGSVIRSIGAVVFDPRQPLPETPRTFYCNISRESCELLGMTVDQSTVEWWEMQSAESRAALKHDQMNFVEAARSFNRWWFEVGGQQVWCQGANFDAPLWESCLAKTNVRAPWRYYNVRDTRTVYELRGWDPRSLPRQAVYHNALDDAMHQARCVQTALAWE